MSEIRLRPINELLSKRFFIPAYQRGFRWNKPQVIALLDDLSQFRNNKNTKDDQYYCLQPIVVKRRADDSWELVDGQQRLTTIYLIMTALDKQMQLNEKTTFELTFETRANSEAFLQDIDAAHKEDNIDYFHICDALDAINEWFQGWDGPSKNDLLGCFIDQTRKNARVIWYELDQDDDAVQAFTRLNVGKIPLTNAELVRALFLCSKNFERGRAATLQQLKIAQEWDAIEKALQSTKVWHFLCSGHDQYPSRIEFIFERLAESENAKLNLGSYSTFYFFSDKLNAASVDVEKEWLKVKQCFMILEEWYENRILHHLIGYLIEDGVPIRELLVKGTTLSKAKFQEHLKHLIYSRLVGGSLTDGDTDAVTSAIKELVDDLDYDDDRAQIKSLLLLFNIATLLLNADSSPMFPFDHYKSGSWDLEHVHSISSDMPDVKMKAVDWLEDFIEHIGNMGENAELCKRAQSIIDDFDLARFRKCYDEILETFQEKGVVDHGVGNLTLLNSGTNRSYKNAVFPVKRAKVIDSEKEGLFVPVCTKNVFLKCYSRRIGAMFYWSKEDRDCYRQAIVDTLSRFFAVELEE